MDPIGKIPCITMRYGPIEVEANSILKRIVLFRAGFIEGESLPVKATWMGTTENWLPEFWNQNWPHDWRDLERHTIERPDKGNPNRVWMYPACKTRSGIIFDFEKDRYVYHKSSLPAHMMIMLMHSYWKKREKGKDKIGLESRYAYVAGITYLGSSPEGPNMSYENFTADDIPVITAASTPLSEHLKGWPVLTMGKKAENFKNYERNAGCVILAEGQQ